MKSFLKYNKTNYLLMEKFCFYTLKQFEYYNLKLNNKTRTFINSWGYILAKKTNLLVKLKKFNLTCFVREGNLLSNITHLFHFFNLLNRNTTINEINKIDFKIIRNKKRKNYDELKSKLIVKDVKGNIMNIQTKKNMKQLINFQISQKKPKINYKILIKDDNFVTYYNSGIKVKKIKFPFSSKTSHIFLRNCVKKNFNYMPTFKNDYLISKLILKSLKVRIT